MLLFIYLFCVNMPGERYRLLWAFVFLLPTTGSIVSLHFVQDEWPFAKLRPLEIPEIQILHWIVFWRVSSCTIRFSCLWCVVFLYSYVSFRRLFSLTLFGHLIVCFIDLVLMIHCPLFILSLLCGRWSRSSMWFLHISFCRRLSTSDVKRKKWTWFVFRRIQYFVQ